jgi:hypothetical protein
MLKWLSQNLAVNGVQHFDLLCLLLQIVGVLLLSLLCVVLRVAVGHVLDLFLLVAQVGKQLLGRRVRYLIAVDQVGDLRWQRVVIGVVELPVKKSRAAQLPIFGDRGAIELKTIAA